MGFVDTQGAFGLLIGIESKDDADSFGPMRSVGLRVEQSQIGREMGAVVVRQVVAFRRFIQEVGFAHVYTCVSAHRRVGYGYRNLMKFVVLHCGMNAMRAAFLSSRQALYQAGMS